MPLKNKVIKYTCYGSLALFVTALIGFLGLFVVRPVYLGWPLTVEQAAITVINDLPEKDRFKLKNMEKEDLIRLHMGFGQAIRNDFGLWGGNLILLLSSDTNHPDSASMVIIERAWSKLQNEGITPK